ncbi:MAG: tetratricopeptide repeat protein [Acidobacteria bacterium]|nr:tetratricopeptide repeat protein [Acidobacteriota bacterium]
MKRAVLAILVLLAGIATVFGYNAAARERSYRTLIAEGNTALTADRPFVAIEAFSGAIALKGGSMLAYLKRGETYRRMGDLSAAARDLRRAVELDRSAPRPLEQLGDVSYALKRYTRAADRYLDYVRLDDRSPRILYKLALARYRAGSAETAVHPLRQAVALDDQFAEAYYLLGLCLRDTDHPAEALTAIERAVELSPALIEARGELADLYAALGRTADHIEQLEALAALDQRPTRQVALGLAYARAGRTDRAVLTLGGAAERYPEHPYVYVALGRVWLESAQTRSDRVALGNALEALQGPVSGADESSEALTLFGRALYLASDGELAERVLQQAVSKTPVDPHAFLYLADAAERQRHFASARESLLKHMALVGPEENAAVEAARESRLGELALLMDEPAEAARWLERATAATPDARLLGRLAEAQWKAGRRADARATLEQGLQREPRNRALLTLRRRLR